MVNLEQAPYSWWSVHDWPGQGNGVLPNVFAAVEGILAWGPLALSVRLKTTSEIPKTTFAELRYRADSKGGSAGRHCRHGCLELRRLRAECGRQSFLLAGGATESRDDEYLGWHPHLAFARQIPNSAWCEFP
ncbi:unnamed protein product [Polarella glacialis]|uniref:Uncharacterized protein n=1 Tax=Polarella glacialis TaxID=89957 RepID=A0A813KEB3_POLGL|nr:unnamed protein product [Polarella glacialis]